VWFWNDQPLFAGLAVRELAGSRVEVEVAGRTLTLAGAPYGEDWRLPDLVRAPPRGPLVLVMHSPDSIESAGAADVYLAGHTHGGQVALPFYGALVTLSRFGKRFEHGLFTVGATSLYVTRGIGMEGGAWPRVRFACRPEISILDLAPVQ
jgi:predicted MPP superfamily phosphohydrolase